MSIRRCRRGDADAAVFFSPSLSSMTAASLLLTCVAPSLACGSAHGDSVDGNGSEFVCEDIGREWIYGGPSSQAVWGGAVCRSATRGGGDGGGVLPSI
jgi:hypothetical protein